MKITTQFIVITLLLVYPSLVVFGAAKTDRKSSQIDSTVLKTNDSISSKKKKPDTPVKKIPTKADTTIIPRQFAFSINQWSNTIELLEIDTTPQYFRNEYPFLRGDKVGAMYLGALGSATAYYNYFDRPQGQDFLFATPYIPYFFDRSSARHYISTTPYALLYYSWGGADPNQEEVLNATYAQSIYNGLSFGANYNTYGTRPLYTQNSARTRAVNVFVSYFSKYYHAHAGYIFNSITNKENGGILSDSMFLHSDALNPQDYDIRISDAKNYLSTQTAYLSHSLDLPIVTIPSKNDTIEDNVLTLRFGHDLEWGRGRKIYTDAVSAYYENNYINALNSRDSLLTTKIQNKIFVNVHPKLPMIFQNFTVGLGYNRPTYYYFTPDNYLTAKGSNAKYDNLFLYGNILANYKNYFSWRADVEQHLLGYKIGDIKLSAELQFAFYPKFFKNGINLSVKGSFRSETPDYFLQNYYTNHYKWNERFAKENEIRISGTVSLPDYGFKGGFHQSLITQPVIFNNYSYPEQLSGAFSISAITLQEHFHFRWIHLLHDVVIQFSSSQQFALPLVSAKVCYYTEFDIVKNVLKMQFGFDFFYTTAFKGYGYNPSVGMFHTQEEVTYGNYPWFDVFISARWYETTPFIKVEHVTEGVFGKNYFSAAHYPRIPLRFKFGISWRFLD